jgi:hypothetical protein
MKGNKPSNQKLITDWVCGTRKHKHGNLILISHRGNLDGSDPAHENTPDYLHVALHAGYAVCCHVILYHGAFFLPTAAGHYKLPYAMLSNPKVWFLADDAVTLSALCDVNAHAVPLNSQVALTSVHYLWCAPGESLPPRSIAVFPERGPAGWLESGDPAGLCSDEISRYL